MISFAATSFAYFWYFSYPGHQADGEGRMR
jgi:hypothetical protein